MTVTIYHNPSCSASRKALGLIRDRGIDPEVALYLRNPPDAATLARLIAAMGIAPRDLLRRRGASDEALAAADAAGTDEAVIAAMAAHPALIERPIVETPLGVRLGRPPERVLDILPGP